MGCFLVWKKIFFALIIKIPAAMFQATMIVADAKESLTITGNGDVVEPHDGVIGAQHSNMHPVMLLTKACTLDAGHI